MFYERNKTMRKLIAMLLALVLCLSLAACSGNGNDNEKPDAGNSEKVDQKAAEAYIQNAFAKTEGGVDMEALLEQIPLTFEDLLTMAELPAQKDAYLAEMEALIAGLEGEISGLTMEFMGEEFSLVDAYGFDLEYIGVKDGALLFKGMMPIVGESDAPASDEDTDEDTDEVVTPVSGTIYVTVDAVTKTIYAAAEFGGQVYPEAEVIPYGELINAAFDEQALVELGMIYDSYMAEMQTILETYSAELDAALGDMEIELPAFAKGDLVSKGDNKYTVTFAYLVKVIKSAFPAEMPAETKAQLEMMLDQLGDYIDLSVDLEFLNKTTVKAGAFNASADIGALLLGAMPGQYEASLKIGGNIEGDASLEIGVDLGRCCHRCNGG